MAQTTHPVTSLTVQVMRRQDARHKETLIRANQAEGHVERLLEALDYIESVLAINGPIEGCGKEMIRRRIMKARRDVMGDEA